MSDANYLASYQLPPHHHSPNPWAARAQYSRPLHHVLILKNSLLSSEANISDVMILTPQSYLQGSSNSSVSKESACTAGDLGSNIESGRSPGEGNGNPLQYSSPRALAPLPRHSTDPLSVEALFPSSAPFPKLHLPPLLLIMDSDFIFLGVKSGIRT